MADVAPVDTDGAVGGRVKAQQLHELFFRNRCLRHGSGPSLVRASESLGSSPSGVSWRVRRLETRIKGKLFERQRYGVMPTSTADTLYRYAVSVFALLEEASLAVKPKKGAA